MSVSKTLREGVSQLLPGARLEQMSVPLVPAIKLHLLSPDYPRQTLTAAQVLRLMDEPLYWTFCWAAGQVLARYILDKPDCVAGKRVMDFGCGSGVVAIAAAMAGAEEVIACDTDPLALQATRLNALANGVALTLADDHGKVDTPLEVIVAADVLYDKANFPWLSQFVVRAPTVLVADSRVKDFQLPPFRLIDSQAAVTFPDLDEVAECREVRLYLAGATK